MSLSKLTNVLQSFLSSPVFLARVSHIKTSIRLEMSKICFYVHVRTWFLQKTQFLLNCPDGFTFLWEEESIMINGQRGNLKPCIPQFRRCRRSSGTVGSIAFSSCNRHIGTLVMITQNGFL